MAFANRVTEILGITHPILQGGMAIAGCGELAAAVSEGGGLGVVASNPGWRPLESRLENVREHVRRARATTGRPLGANIPLFAVDDHDIRHAEMVVEEGVDVVVTGGGSPRRLTPRLKALGVKVVHVVGSPRHARAAEDAGVDIVVCEGYEAGGVESPEEMTTLVLVPACVDAVRIPVVAAGGIGDGRGLAAALALGAEGVQMGTAFLATEECHIHQNAKRALVDADASTVMTQRVLGRLSRVLKTELSTRMAEIDRAGDREQMMALLRSRAPKDVPDIRKVPTGNLQYVGQMMGDLEGGEIAAGQSVALLKAIRPAAQVVADTVAEAEAALARLGALAGPHGVRQPA